jgi:hypothetical protein
MRARLRLLYEASPPLAITGWLNWTLALAFAIAYEIDSRTILGIDAWTKPIKFSVSIAIFTWTLAWYLRYLTRRPRAVRVIAWGVSIAMLAEILGIAMQSWRGVPSHFNVTTPFNALVFASMGIMIALNTALALWALVLFCIDRPAIPDAYLWGIRCGMAVFLLAGFEGALIISRLAHTVGGPDGAPGLFFVNWSTRHGDLRVAHFFGMHALQILPLAGYTMHRTIRDWSDGQQVASVVALSVVYAAMFGWLVYSALRGVPLIAG